MRDPRVERLLRMQDMSRRQFTRASLGALAGIAAPGILAGCGGGDDNAGDTTAGPTETGADSAAGEPRRGGTLRFGRNQETFSVHPFVAAENGSIFTVMQIFSQLVEYRAGTNEVVPGLAESWDLSDDGLTYTFHLREAVFSNGDPVTADDVKFSLDRFADPEQNAILPFLAYGYESSEVVDERTVDVHLQFPVGGFLENISVFPASIVSKKVVEEVGDEEYAKAPIASGPFVVKEFVEGQHVLLGRNESFWEEGVPYLDEVLYELVVDDNTRLLKLQAGEIDAMENVPFNQVETLENDDAISVEVAASTAIDQVSLNNAIAPYDEVEVRQALNYATNKDALNEAVYFGLAPVANDLLPISNLSYTADEIPPIPFDLDRARELLAGSSVPDGFSATFLVPAGDSVHKQVATVLQAQWAEIGVTISVEEIEPGALIERYFAGDYEVAIAFEHATADVVSPDELTLAWYDPDGAQQGFWTFFKDDQLWELTQQLAQSTDEADRKETYGEIQRRALEVVPWVPLFFPPLRTAYRSNVHDLHTTTVGWWILKDAWVDAT